jgi:protein-tyrosine phosphatase
MTTVTDLRLKGASNFRDIGGGLGAEGRRIRRERVFRSGELSRLTDDDLATLRRLGVRFIADLRSAKECDLLKSRLPDAEVHVHRADITMDIRIDGRHIMDHILDDPTPEGTARAVALSFGPTADFCGPALKLLVERLVHEDAPLLFHCTNGRDRTGVIAAMLLYLLGASREAIVTDFMLTNERIDVEIVVKNSILALNKAFGREVSREFVESVTLVKPFYIDTMFAFFAEKYGSPEGYLSHFDIDAALTGALRERLLER